MMKSTLLLLLAGTAACRIAAASAPDVTLRVAPERDLIYSRGSREVIVQIEVAGRRPDDSHRVPMNVAVALDRSGSMAGAKIEKARQAACLAVDRLGDDDYFSLVEYDNRADVLLSAERVGGARHREELKSRIERIRPGGGTALHAGVSLAAEEIRRHMDKEFLNRIVLLSDGIANVGPSRTSDLAELGRRLRGESISVTTIGVGDDYNEDLMTALAEAGHGNYYYVRDAETLPGIFSEELGVARTLVARELTIRITVPDGVRLKEIIGRPDIEVREREAQIRLPEYFGAERRRFLARCAVTGDVAAPLEVAQVALNYEPAGGGHADAQNQSASIKFTDEETRSEKSMRVEVRREVGVIQNRLSKERAVRLADEGKNAEAAQVLREQAVANAAAPAPAQLPGLAEENRKLEAVAGALRSKDGLDSSARKQFQYENYQDKYQKR